ncbi:MAG TPA: 16S rRNA (cytidine(1402)-2'-O)-methyltransferase, partial [Caulobacterales bacterium]|nr:16S rRNA (cytidine(1402)-2'-O)-methyltransferase [Caulobacterales bacterium]
MFAGFPPPKSKARRDDFAALAAVPASLVFFESGPRLAESLADMAAVFCGREAVIGRELTKMFEEFRRGALPDLAKAAALAEPPKGEIVVVVAAPAPQAGVTESDIEAGRADTELRRALARLPVREAVQEVAAVLAAPRRPLYQRALFLKGQSSKGEA